MREILFRGKRKDNGEWVCGDLIHGQGGKTGNMYILPQTQFYPKGCNELDGWNIIPESVGQYTRLKDKSGKMIFEGDLVKFADSPEIPPLNVCFKNGAFGLWHSSEFLKDMDGSGAFWGYMYRLEEIRFSLTIVGNIHDNPDLIKKKS